MATHADRICRMLVVLLALIAMAWPNTAPRADSGLIGTNWRVAEIDGKPIHYCRGFHGEYVVVIPHERLVFVRTGMKREEVNAEGHPQDVFQWIAIARELAARNR